MVNMDKLPEGTEFAKKGGVNSIARSTTHESEPAYTLAAQILMSRGYRGWATDVAYKADASKSMLSAKVLANNGVELQSDGSYRKVSAEKARQLVNNIEMGRNVISSKGITR